jgi:hypothetical protein
MNEMAEIGFLPWEDEVLLSEESTYSVLSKVSWFLAVPPVVLIYRLGGLLSKEPCGLRLTESLPKGHLYPPWINRLSDDGGLAPRVHGRTFREHLKCTWTYYLYEVPHGWRLEGLALCSICIASGVHLRVHQHTAIARCPVHDVPLTKVCPYCGATLSDGYASLRVKAFSCGKCRTSLLPEGNIVTRHAPDFAQSVAEKVREVLSWLKPLQAAREFSLGSESVGAPSGRHLLLEAMTQSSEPVLSCITRPHRRRFTTGLRRIQVRQTPLATVFAKFPLRELAPESRFASGHRDREFLLPNVEAYQCALRRVTWNFLLHQGCSDQSPVEPPFTGWRAFFCS